MRVGAESEDDANKKRDELNENGGSLNQDAFVIKKEEDEESEDN